jgi:hypothetical protein
MLVGGKLPLPGGGPAPQLLTSPPERTEQLQTAAIRVSPSGPRRPLPAASRISSSQRTPFDFKEHTALSLVGYDSEPFALCLVPCRLRGKCSRGLLRLDLPWHQWLILAWLVAKATACQDDNQQCWHPKADEGGRRPGARCSHSCCWG